MTHFRLLAVVLLVLLGACEEPEATVRPNLIYVLADDLGWGEVGAYGQTKIRTPRLDRLAKEGLRFTQHYAGSAVCAPSRCVLLTGLHSGHCVIRDNDEMGHRGDVWNDPALEGQRPLPEDTVTLATLLKEAGYATGMMGKWGLGWAGSTGDPNAQGFDHYLSVLCQRVAHNHYPTHLWRDGEKVPLDNAFFKAHQKLPEGADPNDPASYAAFLGKDYSMDRLTDDALAFVREHKEEPFFLYVPYLVPHVAIQVPEDALAEYAGAFEETPYVGGRGYLPHRTPRAGYAAMITRMDRDIGRIVDLVDELGLGERTLIVFSSDNGPSWVGGVDREYFESSGPFRGRKAQLYEGGIRVPMIARWTGTVASGGTTDHVSAFQDVLPTFVEAAGGAVPDGLDGISFLPTLRGDAEGQAQHEVLYWEHARRWQAVRAGRWKAVRKRPTQALELYDLVADPHEKTDVAAANPDVALRMGRYLDSERTPSELFPLVADK